MDNEILEKIHQKVVSLFPYLKEVTPLVSAVHEGLWDIKYTGSVLTANGQSLPVIVKIAADDQGNILKLTTSR